MNGIDTTNKFLVSAGSEGIRIMNPPRGPISGDDAYLLAAYLQLLGVAASPTHPFADVLTAVRNA